jgi:ATP-binding cassette subfamily A (ABC1) protein 3
LDEADLLGDNIAILAAPGKLVARGTPVALKSTLGEGYGLRVSFDARIEQHEMAQISATLLGRLRDIAPASISVPGENSAETLYQLKTKDATVVRSALEILEEAQFGSWIASYDVQGASIEGIFLDLMAAEGASAQAEKSEDLDKVQEEPKSPGPDTPGLSSDVPVLHPALNLTDGRSKSPIVQTFTIFYKRTLIARRAWLTPLLAVLVAVCGACIPLVFLSNHQQSCVRRFEPSYLQPLYLPFSPIALSAQGSGPESDVYASPPGILQTLGSTARNVSTHDVPDNATFAQTINSNYRNLELGGVSFDFDHNASMFAWEASPPGDTGPTVLSLVSNILYNRAINATGNATTPHLIMAYYSSFPPVAAGTLVSLKWVAFFGAALVSWSLCSSQCSVLIMMTGRVSCLLLALCIEGA